ncbi:MAG: SAF domain-containing protein [Actinomycetes bacterium]
MNTSGTPQSGTDRSSGTPSTSVPWGAGGLKRNTFSRLRATNRRSIPHLLLGALLVLVCAAGFLVIWLNTGNRQPVLALARGVPVGHVLSAQDLRQVNVAVDPGVSVVDANQAASVVGKTMSTSLPAGSLLTPEAIGGLLLPDPGQAIAALALKAGQFPPEISPGSHVLVVFAPGQMGAASMSPRPVDASWVWPAVVTSVSAPANEQTTVVSVELSEPAARQVAAVPSGQLSMVMLATAGGGR